MRHYLIQPTWRCQNKCSYCWMQATIGQRPDLLHAQERSAEDWYNALKRDRPELVDIAGGEPLLLEWVPDLMRICRSLRFGLSTNGLATRGIDNLCRSRVPNLVAVNVSLHPETRVPDYAERFKDAVMRLKAAGYHVHCNLVDAPGNVEKAAKLLAWMQDKDVAFEVSPFERVEQLGYQMETGLVCKGGVNHLVMAPDGSAWPCLTALRSPYYAELCLGNWLDDTVDVAKKPQPCYLACTDYYVLSKEHSAGDMWGVEARPA